MGGNSGGWGVYASIVGSETLDRTHLEGRTEINSLTSFVHVGDIFVKCHFCTASCVYLETFPSQLRAVGYSRLYIKSILYELFVLFINIQQQGETVKYPAVYKL